MSGLYRRQREALSGPTVRAIERGILEAPELGPSPLGNEFYSTQGFSIICRRSSLGAVIERFPYLEAFIEAAVFPASNAFYINPLVMTDRSRVGVHVDCRLVEGASVRVVPTLVSVLYVRCPNVGGVLVLDPSGAQVSIEPATGDIVHFRGSLPHTVSAVPPGTERISVVCEQYNLEGEALTKFPELTLLTGQP